MSILNSNLRLKREIERILYNLDLEVPRRDADHSTSRPHQQIQKAFVRHGWQAEALVSQRTAKRHHFDLFKERVAIEIELSSRDLLYRDYLRFLLAEAENRIDVGVILLLDYEARYIHPCGMRNGLPRMEDVEDDLRSLRSAIGVPIWVIALG